MDTEHFTLDGSTSDNTPVATIVDNDGNEILKVIANTTKESDQVFSLSLYINRDVLADPESTEQWIDITEDGVKHFASMDKYTIRFKKTQDSEEDNIGSKPYCGIKIDNVDNEFIYYLYNENSTESEIKQEFKKYPNQVLKEDVYNNLVSANIKITSDGETSQTQKTSDVTETLEDVESVENVESITTILEEESLGTTAILTQESSLQTETVNNSSNVGSIVFLVLIFIIVSLILAIDFINFKQSKASQVVNLNKNNTNTNSEVDRVHKDVVKFTKKVEELIDVTDEIKQTRETYNQTYKDIMEVQNQCYKMLETIRNCMSVISKVQEDVSSNSVQQTNTPQEVQVQTQVQVQPSTPTQMVAEPTSVQMQPAITTLKVESQPQQQPLQLQSEKELSLVERIYLMDESNLDYYTFNRNKNTLRKITFQEMSSCNYKAFSKGDTIYLVPVNEKIPTNYPGLSNYFEFDSSNETLYKDQLKTPCIIRGNSIEKGSFR